jgi:hypothetical protein
LAFFVKAHYESGYEEGKAKSNSLLYIYNADTDKASWATYDVNLDPWTKEYLGENPKPATTLNQTPCSANTIRALRMLHLLQKRTQNLPSNS